MDAIIRRVMSPAFWQGFWLGMAAPVLWLLWRPERCERCRLTRAEAQGMNCGCGFPTEEGA